MEISIFRCIQIVIVNLKTSWVTRLGVENGVISEISDLLWNMMRIFDIFALSSC